jgi:hypothetical protein
MITRDEAHQLCKLEGLQMRMRVRRNKQIRLHREQAPTVVAVRADCRPRDENHVQSARGVVLTERREARLHPAERAN